MISSLYIKNVAVVKELCIDFRGGLSTLTGETGVGKSVIMDCIGILLGSRPTKGKIRQGEHEAIIRAYFCDISEGTRRAMEELGFDECEEILLQRTFNSEGKSVAKINGQTVTRSMLGEIGAHLIGIHGQNDNQRLMQRSEHLNILDSYAGLEAERAEYREVFDKYRAAESRMAELRERARDGARLLDVYRFQAKEIDELHLRVGEEERLLAEEKRLENAEKIEKHSKFVYHALLGADRSAAALTDKAASSLSQLSGVIPEAEELGDRLVRIRYEIESIAQTAADWSGSDTENAEKLLDKIGARLNAISKLKKKYGGSEEAILAFRAELEKTINDTECSDLLLEECEREMKQIESELLLRAEGLSEKRRAAAHTLERAITGELEFLEMPRVRFVIRIVRSAVPTASGTDDVEFLVATNAGQEPMPMIKIASGGELSRIMLAIKSILLDKDGTETVIFDEIDTGISGKTSRKVGIKLKRIAGYAQVICVTHSAQIASLADNHYVISKREEDGAAQTGVALADDEARVREVARILGGLTVTEGQLRAAREMIEEGKTL